MPINISASETAVQDTEYLLIVFETDAADNVWLVRAFEANFSHNIFSYKDIKPLAKEEVPIGHCQHDHKCIMATARESGVGFYLHGTLVGESIELSLYQTANNAKLQTGVFAIAEGDSLEAIKLTTFRMLKPLLAKGGVIEQLRLDRQSSLQDSVLKPEKSDEDSRRATDLGPVTLGFLVCILAGPLFFKVYLAMRTRRKTVGVDYYFLGYCIFFLLSAGLLILSLDAIDFSQKTDFLHLYQLLKAEQALLMTTSAGILWSIAAIFIFDFIGRPIYGMERVPAKIIRVTLRSYFVSMLLRSIFVGGLSFFALSLIYTAFPSWSFFDVELPLLFFAFMICVVAFIEVAARYCDSLFIASDKQINREIHGYLEDYLTRYGVCLPEKTKNSRFYMGEGPLVFVYGGPLSKPRIVIGDELLTEVFGEDFLEKGEMSMHNPPRDFLYGALMRPLALIYRQSHWRLSFLNIFFFGDRDSAGFRGQAMWKSRRLYERYSFIFERAITDCFATVCRGYHNLIQYYFYMKFDNREYLTRCGDHKSLTEHSEAILELVERITKQNKGVGIADVELHRILTLGSLHQPHVLAAKKPKPSFKARVIRLFLVVIPIAAATTVLAVEAVNYHPVYEAKIAAEKKKRQEYQDKRQKKTKVLQSRK